MQERLLVSLETLPEEGKELNLQLDPAFFDLPKTDGAPAGPVLVDGRVQRFESELVVMADIEAPFGFTCTGCLKDFVQTIVLEQGAIAYEIDQGGEIDLTEALREEILMNFPAHPRCDEGDEECECIIDDRYLAVDKSGEDDVKTPPTPQEDNRWGALDGLSNELPGSTD